MVLHVWLEAGSYVMRNSQCWDRRWVFCQLVLAVEWWGGGQPGDPGAGGWPQRGETLQPHTLISIQYTYFNLQSLQWNDMSDHGPRLPRQGEGRRQTSEETLCQRRESVTQSGGHLNQWKRGNCTVAGEGKEMETNMRRVMHSRERAIYSRSNSVWGSGQNSTGERGPSTAGATACEGVASCQNSTGERRSASSYFQCFFILI